MPGTLLHFCLGPVLIAGGSQENRLCDAAALHMYETCVRIGSEVEVRVQDRSAPQQARLSRQVLSGRGRRENRFEKCPSLHGVFRCCPLAKENRPKIGQEIPPEEPIMRSRDLLVRRFE